LPLFCLPQIFRRLRLEGQAGIWQLHYRPDQLKIDEHDGEPNEFRMAWPQDIVADLDEYLTTFRPRFPDAKSSRTVFLSYKGKRAPTQHFRETIRVACWQHLRKRISPHLFRTIWTDAYLDAHPGDFEGAAAMLNDKPETVAGWYRQFRVAKHLAKAEDFTAKLFGPNLAKAKILAKYNTVNQVDRLHGSAKPAHAAWE
jgi:hypothetical protein